MSLWRLLTMAAATSAHVTAPQPIVLQNEHLTVTFASSDAGPRLTAVRRRATDETFRFANSDEVLLAIARPEDVNDPAYRPRHEFQQDFRFERAEVADDRTSVVLAFGHALLRVRITYQLQADAPVLRKTIVATAGAGGAYVAGVKQWFVKPADAKLAWPTGAAMGQPAVLLGKRGGCFLTQEAPMARFLSSNGDVRIGHRPGYTLGAGESREIAAGSIGCFAPADLETARRAFFAHVADRVKPKIPFPVKFTTWGPWLGQANAARILETIDDMQYVGVDLVHFDAGWQEPDHPYSKHLPQVRDADDETWDRAMTQSERLPDGLLPIVRAAKKRAMAVSLWFDACGNVFVREGEQWAIRDKDGKPVVGRMWEGRWKEAPRQSLASEYGDRLREFVMGALKRYDLAGMLFDNNHYTPDFAPGRRFLACGWNARDVQLRQIMEILDEAERRRPGIYRFYCVGASWPWALLHATHIHAGDPGTSEKMREAMATDHPARALAFERRLAWQRHYDHFVPPWGVKGDIAGWSVQQGSPIPVNLRHTGQLVPTGEGWTQNMFTCFATTAVRDVRFSFRQMPAFDRGILKEWLAWDRRRTQNVINCRPIMRPTDDPNAGLSGYSHVADGKGVMYLFNSSFELAEAEVTLDEKAGFRPDDRNLSTHIVYPMKARLGDGKASYGDTWRVPLIGKDCVVIEVGLDAPAKVAPYADYEKAARSVRRSFATLWLASAEQVVEAIGRGHVQLDVGQSPRDRRLAAQVLETLGAACGRRLTGESTDPTCRVIVGTHEGLADHRDVGRRFREVLYNRYVAWDDTLVSAPLVARLPDADPPTFCLIAPRAEQLARLAIDLVTAVAADAKTLVDVPKPPFRAELPPGRTALRFRPFLRSGGNVPIPDDVSMLRFTVEAEHDGTRTVRYSEDIPPFRMMGHGQWWDDRLVSTADLAGRNVTFRFNVSAVDGTVHPRFAVGFDRIALVALEETQR